MLKNFTCSLPLRISLSKILAFICLFILLLTPLITQAQTTIVSYDFNSGNQGWTTEGWTRANRNGVFPGNNSNSWNSNTTANYANNLNTWVESPTIDLSGYAKLDFSISIRYQTASNTYSWIFTEWDAINIEYTTNGGTNWHLLGSRGEGTNWYNQPASGLTTVATLGTGWAGNNNGWQTASIVLPADLINQTAVQFRVRFASNNTATSIGVAFDNVVITGSYPISFAPADGSAPGGVANNLSLWLKANQEVKESSSNAYAWGDRSGNNNHAFQLTETDQPQYIPDALNGNPVVYFEQGPYMDGGAGFYTQQYFIVVDPNEIYNNTNAVGRIVGFQPGGFGNLSFGPSTVFSENEIITHAIDGDGYRAMQENNVSNYGNPSLIVSQNNTQATGFKQLIFNNGLQVTTAEASTGNFKNLSNQGYRLGDVFNAAVYSPFNGRIAEVISYSSPLSVVQRRDVETYLAIKYGITLDISTQNYTVSGTSIYENKSYAKDIAGIGRNLASQGLNQTASKSVNQGAIIKIANPSSLDNGDYLIWGDDGGPVSWIQASVPAGNADRFARTWYVQETGDVGTVDVIINLNQLGIDIDNSTVNLFQAPAGASVPNTFSTATTHTNGVRSVNSEGQTIVTFHNINFSNGEYFTIGGDIQTTSPGGVKDNLSMWFKADGGIALTGNSVMRWADYSGNANDVYQGNNSLRPTYVKNEINFNPAIRFDNDYLDGIDGFYTQDYFVVAKPNATVNNTNQGALLGFKSGTNSSLALGRVGSSNNAVITHMMNTAYRSINSTSLTFLPPLIINPKNVLAGTNQELFVNGKTETFNGSNGTFTNFSNSELRIGSAFNGLPYAGQIAEVISYSSRLNDVQRRDVQTYLAIKYGITLNITSQNYTARGNNIYNFTTHPNDIAGIGRDLDNGYNQTRSKSSNTGAIIEMSYASSLDNGDYLVWGKDGGSATSVQTTEKPAQYDERLAAEYRVAVTGTPGTVTVKIHIGGLPNYDRRSRTANFYSLLINASGDFTSVSSAIAANSLVGDTLVFNNVSFANGNYFTLAIPAIPAIGTNNTLWLRADKGLTLSGSEVTNWTNQSGANNHASAAATGPTLVNNIINGNPSLTFNGPTLEGTAGFHLREYFVLAAPDLTYSSTSSAGFMVGFETGQASGLALGNSVTNMTGEVLTHVYRGTYRAANVGTATFSNPSIFNSRNPDGSTPQTLFINGVGLGMTYVNTFANQNNRPYRLGNNFVNAVNTGAFNGKISEVLSFSTTQTNVEKRNVESYLALKYGITLNVGNYTIGGVTVFNTGTFPGFANNVTGIASYARYDFLQTSSKSINPGAVLTISDPGSIDNNDFLVTGDDAGAMTSTASGVPTLVGERVNRKWAVQTTNTPGTVTLRFDLTGLGYHTKTINDFSLILDTDSNFGNGVTRLVIPTSWVGQVVTFTQVNLSGINYFGLGTAIDLLSDTDTDGIPDYFEIAYGTNPNDGNLPVIGGSPFTDSNDSTGINGDGISDALEKILIDNGARGPITRYTDTDGDGIPDWIEVKNGTNPFNAHSPTPNGNHDSDGDGLPNALEALIAQRGGAANTSITTDTDGDGVADFLEIINNTLPNNANSPMSAGATDTDGDGVSNAMEAIILAGGATGSVDKESDTDGDGIPDYIEAITFTDPFNLSSPVLSTLAIRIQNADLTVSGGSCINLSGHQWINVVDQAGRLVFSINPVGNNLGSTCYGVRISENLSPIRTNGEQHILDRNWWITPTQQPTGEKVYIRFYVMDTEMGKLWNKAVDLGIITSDVNETLFNQNHVRVTRIENMNTLDPLQLGGDRSILTSKLLTFGDHGRILTVGTPGFSSFIVHTTSNNVPLPVNFLYFKGKNLNKGVELTWATASETNNSHFVVERSGNNMDFNPIRQVKGGGNSSKTLKYNWVDTSPLPGISYYRLKQVDFDEQYAYSKIIQMTVAEAIIEEMALVYPNPTSDLLTLHFTKSIEDVVPKISLYDLSGRKCNVGIRQEDRHTFILDLGHLSSGTYMIKVFYRGEQLVKLILKE